MPTNPTATLALACTLLCVACGQKKEPINIWQNEWQIGTFTDTRDGKIYKTVKIGEQVWFAENNNYNASGSKCHDNKPANCDKYGRLYNWETAKTACPNGWHLPTNGEWNVLTEAVGGEDTAGKYLKATNGWNWNNDDIYGNGEDKFGFSALPGGLGGSGGYFIFVGSIGGWWSANEYDSSVAYYRSMDYLSEDAYYYDIDKSYLFSVRCLQD